MENPAIWHKGRPTGLPTAAHKLRPSVTVPALVPGRIRSRTGKLAAPALLVALLAASAALAAPGAEQARGAKQLSSRVERALLDLYALDSRLHAARARVSYLETAAASLRHRRSSLRQELGAAQATLVVSQRELAVRLRDVYEHGSVDALAVVFGAGSLGKGLQRLDDLKRNADESSAVAAATLKARVRLRQARRTLSADGRRLERSLAAARAAERSLAGSVAARSSYLASLRRSVSRTDARTVVVRAHAAVQKSQTVAPAPRPVAAPVHGGRKLVVSATCYILKGTTASGMPVQKGVVAVDPNVIPLGTKLYIPGYGNGVAADVGGGIKGAIIDLWYPTYAQCATWGRRTVTITIY
jgi:3D (Asp-Asp-Asp) domain-containing protein/peptidoglycan hydrolase CwlO-like protein